MTSPLARASGTAEGMNLARPTLGSLADTTSDLLTRAFTDPGHALDEAGSRLPGATGAERVALLRVMGNACRELVLVDESIRHLTSALDAAIALDDAELEGLTSMSLAASLSYSGDFGRSLELAARAVTLLEGDHKVVAMSQQAGLLQRAGRNPEALRAFDAALEAAEGASDATLVGEIWANRLVLLGWAGEIDAAEADARRALELFESQGWTKRAADMRHNLAWLAARRGDLVESFRRFAQAERAFASLGLSSAALFPDRAEALLAAGLTREALRVAERSARNLRARTAPTSTWPKR